MYQNKKIHLIGIGGVSMSGIAEMLLSLGATVTGSDVAESKITKHLEALDIIIRYGHHPELIEEADIIVYSAAIHEDDPERAKTFELNKPQYERANFLGQLMLMYKNRLCISGTHGKSTTTGMVSSIFLEAQKNPTIQIGAILPAINSTSFIGSKNYLILEACEYVDSFLSFSPTAEIITNIDNDHLDYFKDLDHIKKSFNKYTNLLPEDGYLVINKDDNNSSGIEKDTKAQVITYGIKNEADFTAQNITTNDLGHYSFDVYHQKEIYLHINLSINGEHNIYNALAAIALTSKYIEDKEKIKSGIEQYHGVERRFEYLGNYQNIMIYDDYAHHPTEIKTTLESTQKVKHNESWAIFQPHTFSRTAEHLHDFAKVLKGFDHIIIAKIYPAREENIYGVSEAQLVDLIKETNPNAIYIDDFDKIVTHIKENAKAQDIVITIGAGPINQVAEKLITK
ncbi:MAG: UDP-N-acetylmuramate--L-alanine ligase [Bacilli bacterium]|nr:UDP-N-acetylmuramate--L-alanine ligase [Bacilli bacterium]